MLTKKAEKDFKKIPRFIQVNFQRWVKYLTELGLENTQKFKGFHDEPLKGERKGQRSVRLNISYRVIYQIVKETREIVVFEVQEINKHDY